MKHAAKKSQASFPPSIGGRENSWRGHVAVSRPSSSARVSRSCGGGVFPSEVDRLLAPPCGDGAAVSLELCWKDDSSASRSDMFAMWEDKDSRFTQSDYETR